MISEIEQIPMHYKDAKKIIKELLDENEKYAAETGMNKYILRKNKHVDINTGNDYETLTIHEYVENGESILVMEIKWVDDDNNIVFPKSSEINRYAKRMQKHVALKERMKKRGYDFDRYYSTKVKFDFSEKPIEWYIMSKLDEIANKYRAAPIETNLNDAVTNNIISIRTLIYFLLLDERITEEMFKKVWQQVSDNIQNGVTDMMTEYDIITKMLLEGE